MKPLFTLLFLFAAINCIAQKRNIYYLKNDGTYVDQKDSADIVRIVSEPDQGSEFYNVAEYYKNGKRKLAAKSSAIDPPKFEGLAITNYESGVRKEISNYKTGVVTGEQYEFFPNGKPYIIRNYVGKVNSENVNEFTITANYDSLGTALVTDGNGYYKGYDHLFKRIDEEGPEKNGHRDGEWKFRDSLVSRIENFTDGKFLSGISTNQRGETTTYSVREKRPSFPGGTEAFSRYLGHTIQYPARDRLNQVQGTVLIRFVVERDGKLSHIKVLRPVSPTIDAEALKVVEQSPAWTPGMQYGKVVRAVYVVPINFSLGVSR